MDGEPRCLEQERRCGARAVEGTGGAGAVSDEGLPHRQRRGVPQLGVAPALERTAGKNALDAQPGLPQERQRALRTEKLDARPTALRARTLRAGGTGAVD